MPVLRLSGETKYHASWMFLADSLGAASTSDDLHDHPGHDFGWASIFQVQSVRASIISFGEADFLVAFYQQVTRTT